MLRAAIPFKNINITILKSHQVAMRALGFEVKKVDVLKILKDYDREGNGKITFEDFNEVGEFFLHSRQLKCQWLLG